MPRDRGQVIVGVQDSLTGLRALREAVATARQRGLELRAVRCERHVPAATAVVERAFAEAMGGIPCDVPVRTAAVLGPARTALIESVTREDDLLVVGASRRRWWWPFRRSIGRYCTHRAACPVLIVPPHRAARELGGRRLARRLRARRELSSLVAR